MTPRISLAAIRRYLTRLRERYSGSLKMLDNPTSQIPSHRAKGQGDQALTVRHCKPRVLMASSVHPWNDVRVYFKMARSIASFAHVRLIAVQAPGSSTPPDGRICIDLLPANGLRPGDRKSIIFRLKRIGMILKSVLLQKYDVFHFHDPELLPAGWLAKLRGKKVIYDIHEDNPSYILEKYWITKLLRMPVSRVFSFVENTVAQQLNFLLTAGPLLKERFEKINPKTEVIHNFPLSVEFVTRTKWDEKQNEVCFIGGITRIRGLMEVLQALEKVNSVTLNLVGSYSSIEFREELRGYQGWEKVSV
ncbi:MAG: glycosyltransferase, partial [Dehalococcoidia bacterium]|nr:glycosyltransferase [Dehalococcoidia bacterium]